jgi:uncharacterized protein (TIGR02145 family)
VKKSNYFTLLTLLIMSVVILALISSCYCLFASCDFDNDESITGSCDNAVTASGTVTCGGRIYRTVTIGSQTWMAENLDFNRSGSGCQGNNPRNCTIYGRLYDWYTAFEVCPDGWHLPSYDEWTILIDFIGSDAGTKLKASDGWDGTDDYGFSALPGGYCPGRPCVNIDYGGYWWTASDSGFNRSAWLSAIYSRDSNIHRGSIANKPAMLSVRCIQTKNLK